MGEKTWAHTGTKSDDDDGDVYSIEKLLVDMKRYRSTKINVSL